MRSAASFFFRYFPIQPSSGGETGASD